MSFSPELAYARHDTTTSQRSSLLSGRKIARRASRHMSSPHDAGAYQGTGRSSSSK